MEKFYFYLKNNFVKIIALVAIVLLQLTNDLYGQTTIAQQDFETTPATPTLTYSSSGGTLSTSTVGTNGLPANSPYGVGNSRGIYVASGTLTFTSSPIDTRCYGSAPQLSFRLSSLSLNSSNGADATDLATVYISTDGTTYSQECQIKGNSNAVWSYTSGTGTLTATYDGNNTLEAAKVVSPAGGGARTTDGFSTIILTGLPSTQNLYVKIVLLNDNTNEVWAIDNVILSSANPATTQPSTPSVTNTSRCGTGTVTLTASGAITGQDYKWYSSLTGGTVLQTGGSTFTTPSLSSTTTYYVVIYNTTVITCESSPRTAVTATINPTPSTPTITPSATTVCNGSIVTLTSSGGNTSILSDGFETFPSTNFGANGASITPSSNSTYYTESSKSILLSYATSPATTTSSTTNSYQSQSNINLSQFSSAQLIFSHICATEPAYDYGYVQYSTDGGSTWTSFPTSSYTGTATLKNSVVSFDKTSYTDWNTQFSSSSSTPGSGPATSLWKTETINIPAAVMTSSQFRIRFLITQDGSISYYGWLLDNVKINGIKSAAVWSPLTGLFTDAGATNAYTGTSLTTVYAKPNTTTIYSAEVSIGSCSSSSASTTITVNNVPSCATNFSPANNTTGIATSGSTLSWTANTGSPTGYDVYFGTNLTLVQNKDLGTRVATNQPGTTYNTGSLVGNTDYYWLIVPINSCGSSTCTTVSKFTTDDSGCTPPTVSSVNKVDVLCFGSATGSISIVATGGSIPYQYSRDNGLTYQLSNTFIGLSAGTYQIKVKGFDDCESATTNVIITQPTNLVANAGTDFSVCTGSSNTIGAIIPATGGSGSYTYSWTPSTGLSATNIANPIATITTNTTYTLTVTDTNGCQATSNITLTIGTGSTKYWAGAGSGMIGATTGTDFNTAANWSSTTGTKTATSAPMSCDNVSITTTGAVVITLSQNSTINDLTILNNANNTVAFDTSTYIFEILGNTIVNANTSGTTSNKISIRVGNSPGKIIFNGNADFGPNAAANPFIGFEGSGGGNTTGTIIFKGNTSFSVTYGALTGSIGNFTWDGLGNQTISTNPSYVVSFPGNVQIGDINTPTVQISNLTSTGCFVGANKNMTIKSGATLNLNTKYFYPNAASTGIFVIESDGKLICGGTINNGSGTNNFPTNFSSYNLNSNSTVEYNATAAQGINATPTYGNLVISNNSVKTVAAGLSIAGNLTVNSTATLALSTFTSSVAGNAVNSGTITFGALTGRLNLTGNLTNSGTITCGTTTSINIGGNWINNGSVSPNTSTITFNGNNALQTISGTATTAFYSLTVNKGTNISSILEINSPTTMSGTLTLTNGLLRLNHSSANVQHGGSITIPSSAGIEINGGILNGSAGTITNNGLFRLISGSATVGNSSGNALLNQTGGVIDIQGGTYLGSGRIQCTGGSFSQSGGTITLCTVGNTSGTIANFDISSSANLNISNGTIIIRLPNTAATPFSSVNILNGGTKTISGGTIQIGDGSTTSSQTFLINSQIPLNNFTINATTQTKTARLVTSDLTINGNLTIEGGTLDAATNNKDIFIKGNWINSGTFSPGTGTVTFNGENQQIIEGNNPSTFTNFRIDNTSGVKSNTNLTVNGILNLNANNPNETNGLLDMVTNYGNYATVNSPNSTDQYNNLNSNILTMGPSANLTGNADVTGKIRRTSFTSGTTYTFGNKNTQLTFTSVSGSALPSQITVVATRGNEGLHVDKNNSIKRLYQILRTGGASETRMTIRLAYENSEINGNIETDLVLWDHHIPYSGLTPHEHGKTNQSSTENWVELANHGLLYLEPENDVTKTKYWMISTKITPDIMWLGSAGGAAASSWNSASNWTSGVVPTATTDVLIPANTIYQTELNIQGNLEAKTIEIKPTAVVNAGTSTLTLHGGPVNNYGNGTWNNQGTFNPGSSTVIFNYDEGTISGNTTFNNITINSNKKATIQGNTIIKIAGTITNNGIFDASSNNTVEYIGNNQSVAVANGVTEGYNNLVINQTSGTGSATLSGNTEVRNNLTLTNGILDLGAKKLTYSGSDISKTNGYINANSTNSIMNFINSSPLRLPADLFQNSIYNLTVNGGGILLGSSTAVANELNLTNGNILLKGYNFTYSGNSINKVNGQINANELSSKISFENTAALALPASLFVNDEVYDMTVNGSGGTTLGSDTSINNQLELTQGNLNIGANTLTLNGPYITGTPNNLKGISSSNINFYNTGTGNVNLPNFTAVNNINFNSNLVYNSSGNTDVYGDVILTSGTLQLGSYTLNRNASGGNFKIKGTSVLKIGGTNSFPTNYATHEVDATTTVDYNGTNQNVAKLNSSQKYGYLALSGTGNKSFDNDVEVENNLTNSSTSTARVANGKVITVKNKVINNGTADNFVFENNSSLIQINDVANEGSIKYKRTATQRQLDYVYWASPVANFNLSNHASNGPKYYWNPTVQNSNGTQGNWQTASGILPAAKGVIVRGPSTFTTTVDSLTVNFAGVPRNGATNFTISRGSIISETNINDNWNLLGNPYPSAISAKEFLLANSSVLREAVYIWNHGTPIGGYESPFYQYYLYNYNPNDYSRYNLTGFSGGPSDDYYIGAGQGFFVAMADGPTGSATVSFTNTFRNKQYGNTTNTNFFRNGDSNSTNTVEEGRIWLNLVNSSNFSPSRTLIGYKEGATNAKDNLHDAIVASDGYAKIYSMVQDQPLIIQGRQLPFNDQDRIPIGYDIATAGNYSIAIHTVDGLFTGNQNIYLEDLTLNVIHDLKQSPYQFSTATGVFRNRFILRFTNSTLGNNDFEMDNSVVIYTDANINIKSAIETIKSVEIFDLLGRNIATFKDVNTSQFTSQNMKQSKLPLLVKVTLENGLTKTYKIIY
ncbi:beta strand repeat-containing protein [Flavobacterium sp.]|uniref:beta strand repeat-containing protein n=1 Tax=Flavobacterium sp. TaxID=239 RepID=UPI002FDCAFC3